MPAPVVDRPQPFQAVLDRFGECGRVALDLEGDGLFRYRARLCTMQLGGREEVAVVDTLALSSELHRLAPFLGPEGPCKVIHDAAYDARLLRTVELELANVFDTAIAARFLGEQATGLASLLDKYLGVVLPKEHQQADWGRRPLTQEKVAYLEDDVRHLLPLADALLAQVCEAGISEEVRLESEYMLKRAREEEADDRPPWMRIKGWDALGELGRAVLREVALTREAEAERADVPPFKVVGNRALLEMAEHQPRSVRAIRRIRGMHRGRGASRADRFVAAIERGREAGAIPEEERARLNRPPPPAEEREARRRRQRALTDWRREEASRRSVDTQVVMPGHCLQDLAASGAETADDLRAIDGFGEVRVERYGEALLELLRPG